MKIATLLLLVACESTTAPTPRPPMLDELARMRDRMCACHDTACVSAVKTSHLDWIVQAATVPLTEAQRIEREQLEQALDACYMDGLKR